MTNKRIPLSKLEHLCQKPDHQRLGNWMARNVARPAALRITRVVAPWGISANTATLVAWACGATAAAAFAWGTVWGWVFAAAMLQVWYLLDHVDGQLARLRGTASLDGVQLDYLMHHTVNLLVPLGIGIGIFGQRGDPIWAAGGLLWGMSLLLLGLLHDTRYKAFMQRLKRIHGPLNVLGGGGGRPQPQPPMPRRPLRLAAWVARKACEMHVIMNAAALLALGQLLIGDASLLIGTVYLAIMSITAAAVAAWSIARSQHSGAVEQEFAAWYRVPPGYDLVFLDGWWFTREAETGQFGESAENAADAQKQSS